MQVLKHPIETYERCYLNFSTAYDDAIDLANGDEDKISEVERHYTELRLAWLRVAAKYLDMTNSEVQKLAKLADATAVDLKAQLYKMKQLNSIIRLTAKMIDISASLVKL